MNNTTGGHCQSAAAKFSSLKRLDRIWEIVMNKRTRVFNLYDCLPRNASSVSHHDVVFGSIRTNSSRTNSNILRSTASVGASGAHGKSPRDNNWRAAGEH